MVDILNNIFGLNMSQGTVSNILWHLQKKAAVETGKIRAAIETSAVVGADETGIKVNVMSLNSITDSFSHHA